MQEVQRFNKVLKSLVLLGDILLLDLLLWIFDFISCNRYPFEHSISLFQSMALMSLCYLLCNMQSGVILHRPVVRPEQIVIRVLRNMVSFILLSFGLSSLFHFECFYMRWLGLFYIILIVAIVGYRLMFRYFLVPQTGRECPQGCFGRQP